MSCDLELWTWIIVNELCCDGFDSDLLSCTMYVTILIIINLLKIRCYLPVKNALTMLWRIGLIWRIGVISGSKTVQKIATTRSMADKKQTQSSFNKQRKNTHLHTNWFNYSKQSVSLKKTKTVNMAMTNNGIMNSKQILILLDNH